MGSSLIIYLFEIYCTSGEGRMLGQSDPESRIQIVVRHMLALYTVYTSCLADGLSIVYLS
jgi:hypothetical protein